MTTADAQLRPIKTLESVTVRFAGDSGDGMQLVGDRFTISAVEVGNDIATLPDYPAEIRAPAGSLAGVSGFQLQFSSDEVHTPGDRIQVLVAMNPAALKVNLADLEPGGMVIANSDSFGPQNLKLARYATNPLEDGTLAGYQIFSLPIRTMTREAVADAGLTTKEADRCKNFVALGVLYWLYDRPLDRTLGWMRQKFGRNENLLRANELAFKAGFHFGETAEMFPAQYRVERARLAPGRYRTIRGNQGLALGLVTAAQLAEKKLIYASYPITPASDILHELAKHKNFGVRTVQLEDEIAAIGAVIGASYGGTLSATGTSGPGMSLKSEGIGLAVMLELPCVIIDAQRGGPSTGLPTKTEQSDLLQALYGRHGECPVPIVAPRSPSDCFWTAIEAVRIALRFMTPVIVLSDGYVGNSAEPWTIPNASELAPIPVTHPTNPEGFQPYSRNDDLARPWALPGTPGMAHRVGGLEKENLTGDVCYDPLNHEMMCRLRASKVAKVADSIPPLEIMGESSGRLLVLSWGGTHGAVRTAVAKAQAQGLSVSHAHLRHMNPFPKNLEALLRGFDRVLIPELNLGQLVLLIRARFLIDAVSFTKIQGKPFSVSELLAKIDALHNEA